MLQITKDETFLFTLENIRKSFLSVYDICSKLAASSVRKLSYITCIIHAKEMKFIQSHGVHLHFLFTTGIQCHKKAKYGKMQN